MALGWPPRHAVVPFFRPHKESATLVAEDFATPSRSDRQGVEPMGEARAGVSREANSARGEAGSEGSSEGRCGRGRQKRREHQGNQAEVLLQPVRFDTRGVDRGQVGKGSASHGVHLPRATGPAVFALACALPVRGGRAQMEGGHGGVEGAPQDPEGPPGRDRRRPHGPTDLLAAANTPQPYAKRCRRDGHAGPRAAETRGRRMDCRRVSEASSGADQKGSAEALGLDVGRWP
mmetsp:Transcript_41129/g.113371  ORF Transcript_41129/g.113371 Transcript_41129/m.113371 type:complete len:233 (+) Transcript_41129:961-1659(+)